MMCSAKHVFLVNQLTATRVALLVVLIQLFIYLKCTLFTRIKRVCAIPLFYFYFECEASIKSFQIKLMGLQMDYGVSHLVQRHNLFTYFTT